MNIQNDSSTKYPSTEEFRERVTVPPVPPSTTATRKKPIVSRYPQEIGGDQNPQRRGGTIPPSTPMVAEQLILPTGKTSARISQISQTQTELPRLENSESQGGGERKSLISSISAKFKSVCQKLPEDNLGSHLLHSENTVEGEPTRKSASKLPSKLENLKMFWENSGKVSEQTSAKPKLCRTNGRGAMEGNICADQQRKKNVF